MWSIDTGVSQCGEVVSVLALGFQVDSIAVYFIRKLLVFTLVPASIGRAVLVNFFGTVLVEDATLPASVVSQDTLVSINAQVLVVEALAVSDKCLVSSQSLFANLGLQLVNSVIMVDSPLFGR